MNIKVLKEAFRELQIEGFPKNSMNSELSTMHSEIIEFDGYVAGIAQSIIKGSKINSTKLNFNNNFKTSLDNLLVKHKYDEELNAEISKYMKYLGKLENLINVIVEILK